MDVSVSLLSLLVAGDLPKPPNGEAEEASFISVPSSFGTWAGFANEKDVFVGVLPDSAFVDSLFFVSSEVGFEKLEKPKAGFEAALSSFGLNENGEGVSVADAPNALVGGVADFAKLPKADGAVFAAGVALLPPNPSPPKDSAFDRFSWSSAFSSSKSSAPPFWLEVLSGSMSSASFSSRPGGLIVGAAGVDDSPRIPVKAEDWGTPKAFFVPSVEGVPKLKPEEVPPVLLEKAPKPLEAGLESLVLAKAPKPVEAGLAANGEVVPLEGPNGLDCPKAAGAGDVAIETVPEGVDDWPKVLVPKEAG